MSHQIIVISGTRTLDSREYIYGILDSEASRLLCVGHTLEFRIGDCRGVDKLAREWARDRGLPFTIYCASAWMYEFLSAHGFAAVLVADWDVDGRVAGHLRNAEMLKGSNLLVAIWDGSSPGTKNAKINARELKTPTLTWIYPQKDPSSVADA